ncbi:MAG: hypothetical protein CSA35_06230 [Dethiosulfovibrio peptidovorans]|nr:MAG: hypothetical protein CSA35_06230 [Dethiosulfovibrio peptidovorans]
MKNLKRWGSAFVFVWGLLLCLGYGLSEAALPKGSIAVLVKSASRQEAAQVASIFTQKLIAKGYKVVDPKKLQAIRKSKAAALALEGNVDAIMKLGRRYGFSTMITANVQAGQPVKNEFKLYTGTSSIAVMVTASNGSQVYADTTAGKQVGYTPSEAQQKSLEAAAELAVNRMTE